MDLEEIKRLVKSGQGAWSFDPLHGQLLSEESWMIADDVDPPFGPLLASVPEMVSWIDRACKVFRGDCENGFHDERQDLLEELGEK